MEWLNKTHWQVTFVKIRILYDSKFVLIKSACMICSHAIVICIDKKFRLFPQPFHLYFTIKIAPNPLKAHSSRTKATQYNSI